MRKLTHTRTHRLHMQVCAQTSGGGGGCRVGRSKLLSPTTNSIAVGIFPFTGCPYVGRCERGKRTKTNDGT